MRDSGERQSSLREHARLGTEPIDGLRGFAVLLVVFYHTWLFSWLDPSADVFGHRLQIYRIVRPGHLGVDIFFVVSAIVLTYPYVRARALGSPLPTLGAFAFRRFVKIVPSYLIVLACSMAVAAANHSVDPGHWPRLIWEHLLFLQNTEYDQLGHDNSVLWSLAVEVQFYVVFPLVVWVFLRSPFFTAATLVAVANAYRVANVACCLHDENVMRALPAYLDLFGIGMFAAWAIVRLPDLLPGWLRHPLVGTLAACGAGYAIFTMLGRLDDATYVKDSREWFAIATRTWFALAIGLFATGSCLGFGWWRRLVGNRVLVGLSLVSYNVYLWHTLIELFLAHHNLPPASTKEPHEDSHWPLPFVIVSFATIGVVCTAITYLVERPLLSLVKPQSFSFDYGRLFGRAPRTSAAEAYPAPSRPRGSH